MSERSGSNTNVDAYNGLSTSDLESGVQRINDNLKKSTDFEMSIMDCKETKFAHDKRPQVTIKSKRYYCAIIVKLYDERLKYGDDYRLKSGFDASHFYCHNPHCVNVDHIHFEHHMVNKSRLCCRLYAPMGYHCPHLPRCHINDYNKLKI